MFAKRRLHSQEIALTSLVDVIMLLLIFFMVSGTFYVSHAINLNFASTADTTNHSSVHMPITLTLKPNKMVLWYESYIAIDKLEPAIKEALAKDPQAPILVRPETTSNIQDLVELLQVIDDAGGKNVALVENN